MASLDLAEPEMFWTRSFDGTRIQGWILKPPGFDPSKQYPLILQIHGGPHAAYGATFTHEFLWMAAKGYVVVYTNPRGSTTLRAAASATASSTAIPATTIATHGGARRGRRPWLRRSERAWASPAAAAAAC